MKMNKILYLAAMPILGICCTSCNGGKTVTYENALSHVVNNFDDHAIDYIVGNYEAKTNKFNIDLKAIETNSIGVEKEYDIAFGLDNISTKYNELPVVMFNSTYLKYIEEYYNKICEFTLEQVTEFTLDKEYKINNGGLTCKIGTDDSVFGLIVAANNALDLCYEFEELYDILDEKFPQVTEITDEIYDKYSVTINPIGAKADGELYAQFTTDNIGCVVGAKFVLKSDLDMFIGLSSRDGTALNSTVHLTGSVNIDTELKVTF